MLQWVFTLSLTQLLRKLFIHLACNVALIAAYSIQSCLTVSQGLVFPLTPCPRLSLALSHWEIKRLTISCDRIEVDSSLGVRREAVTAAFSWSCNIKDPSLNSWAMCVILSDVFIRLQQQLSFWNVTKSPSSKNIPANYRPMRRGVLGNLAGRLFYFDCSFWLEMTWNGVTFWAESWVIFRFKVAYKMRKSWWGSLVVCLCMFAHPQQNCTRFKYSHL